MLERLQYLYFGGYSKFVWTKPQAIYSNLALLWAGVVPQECQNSLLIQVCLALSITPHSAKVKSYWWSQDLGSLGLKNRQFRDYYKSLGRFLPWDIQKVSRWVAENGNPGKSSMVLCRITTSLPHCWALPENTFCLLTSVQGRFTVIICHKENLVISFYIFHPTLPEKIPSGWGKYKGLHPLHLRQKSGCLHWTRMFFLAQAAA